MPYWCETCSSDTGNGCECEEVVLGNDDDNCSHKACEVWEPMDCGEVISGMPTPHRCVGLGQERELACRALGHKLRECC